jgi:hypothetical protein
MNVSRILLTMVCLWILSFFADVRRFFETRTRRYALILGVMTALCAGFMAAVFGWAFTLFCFGLFLVSGLTVWGIVAVLFWADRGSW